MSRTDVVIAVVLACVLRASTIVAQPTFTQTAEFCSVDMSYQQLTGLIARMRELTQRANAAATTIPSIDQLSLQHGGTSFDTETDYSLPTLSQGPEVATTVRYSFGHTNQPISEIVLQLGDYSRSVTVSGSDRVQVDSLLSLVSSDVARVGCSLGGSFHRMVGGFLLVLLTVIMTSSPVLNAIGNVKLEIAIVVIGLVNLAGVFLLPWADWLPGTAVRVTEASFIERNAAPIGFLGLLITLVSLALSVVSLVSRRRRTGATSAKLDGSEDKSGSSGTV